MQKKQFINNTATFSIVHAGALYFFQCSRSCRAISNGLMLIQQTHKIKSFKALSGIYFAWVQGTKNLPVNDALKLVGYFLFGIYALTSAWLIINGLVQLHLLWLYKNRKRRKQ
jgi:hypothetical protein